MASSFLSNIIQNKMSGSILHGKRANHDFPVHGHSHYDIIWMRIETQIDRNLYPSGPLQIRKEERKHRVSLVAGNNFLNGRPGKMRIPPWHAGCWV
jgi:hypothetical protein